MNEKLYKNLENSISEERLSHYSKVFQTTDKKILIQKYLLNVELSKSLYLPLQNLEITFRNSIYETLSNQLKNKYWFEDETFVSERLKLKVQEAKNKIALNREVTSGRIISELNFGFWTYLLGKEYQQKIWNKYIKLIFPNISRKDATRNNLSKKINTIRNLRNKVFHFDTIIHMGNLFDIHKQILELIYWLNKNMYNLTIEFDEFEYIYNNKETIIKEKLENLNRRIDEKL